MDDDDGRQKRPPFMAAIRRRAIQEHRNLYTPSRTMSRMFLSKNLKTDWTVFEKMAFKVPKWPFFDENGRHLWPPYRDERFNSNETYTHHQGPCLECSQIKISKLIEQFLRKWHSKSQNGHFSMKTAAIYGRHTETSDSRSTKLIHTIKNHV